MAITTPEPVAAHDEEWSARLATEFEAALPDLAKAAFSDPSIRTNPRIPLLTEIVGLLQTGYSG